MKVLKIVSCFGLVLIHDLQAQKVSHSQIVPNQVSASTTQENMRGYNNEWITFYPSNIIDGKVETSWSCDSKKGDGREWIRFDFEEAVLLSQIRIHAGWWYSKSLWDANSRISHLAIETSNGDRLEFKLKNEMTEQTIKLKNIAVSWIKLEILNSHFGSSYKFKFGPISEVAFYGAKTSELPLVQDFFTHIKNNKLSEVSGVYKKLMKMGLDASFLRMPEGYSPLEFTVRSGYVDVVDYLLENGVISGPVKLQGYGTSIESISNYTQKVVELRKEYQETISGTGQQYDWAELIKLENNRNYDFLFPEETKKWNEWIREKKTNASSKESERLVQLLRDQPVTYQGLEKVYRFREDHAPVLEFLTASDLERTLASIDALTDKLLTELLYAEQIKAIEKTNTSLEGLFAVNQSYGSILSNYSKFKSYLGSNKMRDLAQMMNLMNEWRGEILNSPYVSYELITIISNENSKIRLNQIKVRLFEYVPNPKNDFENIYNWFEVRAEQIVARDKAISDTKARLAMLRNKRMEEAKLLAAERRRKLSLIYETNFPTLEDMYEIETLASAIGTSYDVKDGDRFIGYLSKKGYYLVGKLYADINTFRNHRGFEIKTWKLYENGRNILVSEFATSSKNVDIIEMYLMEITSECRKIGSANPDAWLPGDSLNH